MLSDPLTTVVFALQRGILKSEFTCEKRERAMTLQRSSRATDGYQLRCTSCKATKSIRANTMLSHSKLTLQQLLIFIYMWAQEALITDIAAEIGAAGNALTRLMYLISSAIHQWSSTIHRMLGGPGHTVEMDETQLSRKKHDKGRAVPGSDVWVFGGIDRATKMIFVEKVDFRNTRTLLPIIKRYVLPHTMIYTDQWSAYNCLNDPKNQYRHEVVNHSVGFVNSENGAHTQCIERLWRDLKQRKKMQYGVHKHLVPRYCEEFMWRYWVRHNGYNAFEKALALVANCHWDRVAPFP